MHAPDFSLAGKTALITGSTQGLGFEIAKAYAAMGAMVIINGRSPERVERAVQAIAGQGGRAAPWVHDVANLEQQEGVLEKLCASVGTPDILVNNVGVRLRQSLSESSLADIQSLMHVDLISTMYLSKLCAQRMVQERLKGRILTLTSIADRVARPGDAIYPVAKHGLAGLVKALAVEFGPHGITSNGIAPGTFATESNVELARDPVQGPRVLGRNPLERWAQPREISGAAVFLASPAASYVNGHILVVDGGFSIAF
ncbi:MAG TPA: SDR family oxidoreductase [Pusillimonas sp.]|uniref:SDR family oxidoreductase n=1 Tax=Pusillimonas sp. TaxID=3040095 RepID=UPI002BC179C5|nr:SDR family oxidoreductase [Pusillimonas sp.]HUH87517.1 SDR family oxidoreductase [Pusillimonas sp.]